MHHRAPVDHQHHETDEDEDEHEADAAAEDAVMTSCGGDVDRMATSHVQRPNTTPHSTVQDMYIALTFTFQYSCDFCITWNNIILTTKNCSIVERIILLTDIFLKMFSDSQIRSNCRPIAVLYI